MVQTFILLIIIKKQKIVGLDDFYFSRIFVYNDRGKLTCATELIQEFFKTLGGTSTLSLDEYVELVRQYDTWDWTKTNNLLSRDMNVLYMTYPKEDFYNNVMDKIKTSFKIILNDTDKLLLRIEHKRNEDYINEKLKNVHYKTILGYNCAIVFAEKNVNEIAQKLYSDDSTDIAIIVRDIYISYRTNKNIDLNKFAIKFGGGGNEKTSGSPISKELREAFIECIFGK